MRRSMLIATLCAFALLIVVEPALAGPGGRIARAVFESFWGRVALVLLIIVFLPLIVLTLLGERRAVRRAQRDLLYLASVNSRFGWLVLRERALACFQRVHAAWRREDAGEAAEFMTSWYWQNQQLVYLDRWAEEGLVNHCEVKSAPRIRPMLVQPVGVAPDFEGTKVVMAISAEMRDYLARRDDGEVVEGSKALKTVETLWTFELRAGAWKVSNIEDSEMLSDYLDLVKDLPRIEEVVGAAQAR